MTEQQHQLAMDGDCLDSEVIACYLDGRLSESEREAVERHLVRCDDCRELVAESFAVRNLMEAEEAEEATVATPAPGGHQANGQEATAARPGSVSVLTPVVHPPRRYSMIAGAAGAMIGLAAALLLVVRNPDVVRDAWNRLTGHTELQQLVAAVGTTREFAARPAGGFAHGPVRTFRRGPDSKPAAAPELQIAVAKIEVRAEHDHSRETLALLGKARLMLGDTAGAIQALEPAARTHPPNAVILNDLAAAYLVRGDDHSDQKDYAQALTNAERARALDPGLLEAWFNRALAADRIGPPKHAILMWQEYLQRDAQSGWADEARERIDTLATAP